MNTEKLRTLFRRDNLLAAAVGLLLECRDGKADVASAKPERPPSTRPKAFANSYFALTMPVNFLASNFFAPPAPATAAVAR
jgi:hypothetical protein